MRGVRKSPSSGWVGTDVDESDDDKILLAGWVRWAEKHFFFFFAFPLIDVILNFRGGDDRYQIMREHNVIFDFEGAEGVIKT